MTSSHHSENLLADVALRLEEANSKLDELAQQYTGTYKLREQVVDILNRWFVHGKTE